MNNIVTMPFGKTVGLLDKNLDDGSGHCLLSDKPKRVNPFFACLDGA
jgi:hypothetical protein